MKGRGTAVRGERCAVEWRLGDSDKRPFLESLGVKFCSGAVSGGGIFPGNGKRGPLFFLSLGRRKNVVVVETVWVVVVVAYSPCSPESPSEREDSDSRETGKASVEFVSSPYAGGGAEPLCLSGSSNVIRDARALGLFDEKPAPS